MLLQEQQTWGSMNRIINACSLAAFLLIGCGPEQRTTSQTGGESSQLLVDYYSIVDGDAASEPSLAEVVPSFKNASPCVLVLDKGETIFTSDGFEQIISGMLKKHGSIDVVYSYSYGFSRICTFRRADRGTMTK